MNEYIAHWTTTIFAPLPYRSLHWFFFNFSPLCLSGAFNCFLFSSLLHKIDLIVRFYTVLLILLLVAPLVLLVFTCARTTNILTFFYMCLSLHSQLLSSPSIFFLFHLTWKCIYEKRLWQKHEYAEEDVRVPLFLNYKQRTITAAAAAASITIAGKQAREKEKRSIYIYLHTFRILTCNLFKVNFSSVA